MYLFQMFIMSKLLSVKFSFQQGMATPDGGHWEGTKNIELQSLTLW